MTTNGSIPRVPVPALVGRKEAAEMLGVYPENIFRDVPGLPKPLHERRIRGFKVASAGAMWPRAEIEALVKSEQRRRKATGMPSLTATRRALAEAKARSAREQTRKAKPRSTAASR